MSSTTRSDTSFRFTEQIDRLVVETAKFLDKGSGDAIPLQEVKQQAQDNGYSQKETNSLLRTAGIDGAEEVTVPEQGAILGALWADGSDNVGGTPESASTAEEAVRKRPSTRAGHSQPEPLDESVEDCYRLHEPIADSAAAVGDDRYLCDGEPKTAFDSIGSYIERRHGESVSAQENGFWKTRHWRAKLRYAKGKEMDRQLLSDYELPTIALLSLRVSPGDRSRLTLLAGMEEAIEAMIKQLRYRLQTARAAPFSAGEWEYYVVVAGTDTRATPHIHVMVYCDGGILRSELDPVAEKFVEKCPYAPDDMTGNKPEEGAVKVRGLVQDDIPRMDDKPAESAGSTYVLSQLPHLQTVDKMALDELLHSSTVDAWQGQAFRRSNYSLWEDDEEPSVEEISEITPT